MCYVLCPCVMELLAKPKKDKNVFIENRYKPILTNYPNLSIVDMEYNIADIASRLRANYNIITPDAIIFATAISMNVDYIITNDIKLKNICENEGLDMLSIKDI